MAIISDFNEEEQKPTHSSPPQPQSSSSSSSFSATFDRSNPIAFLERVFEFVSEQSDFLATQSAEKELVSLVHAAGKKKRELLKAERENADKKKREDLKVTEERQKVEKRLNEEKELKAEDTNKNESASRGKPTKTISPSFFQCAIMSCPNNFLFLLCVDYDNYQIDNEHYYFRVW